MSHPMQELMEGGSLFAGLDHRDPHGSGRREFGWYQRGAQALIDAARGLHYLHRCPVLLGWAGPGRCWDRALRCCCLAVWGAGGAVLALSLMAMTRCCLHLPSAPQVLRSLAAPANCPIISNSPAQCEDHPHGRQVPQRAADTRPHCQARRRGALPVRGPQMVLIGPSHSR